MSPLYLFYNSPPPRFLYIASAFLFLVAFKRTLLLYFSKSPLKSSLLYIRPKYIFEPVGGELFQLFTKLQRHFL